MNAVTFARPLFLDAHHREPPYSSTSRYENKANEDTQHGQHHEYRMTVTCPEKDCTQPGKDQNQANHSKTQVRTSWPLSTCHLLTPLPHHAIDFLYQSRDKEGLLGDSSPNEQGEMNYELQERTSRRGLGAFPKKKAKRLCGSVVQVCRSEVLAVPGA